MAMKSVILIAILLPAITVNASETSLKSLTDDGLIDMPVTTAPATFLLGASGQQVPRLSTFRAFAAQVARAYDEDGKLANAVAVEIAPTLALGRTTWDDIVEQPITRILSRTTLSFASKTGKNNQNQSAVGLQSILYSKEMDGAILLAAREECRTAAAAIDDSPPPLDPGGPAPTMPADVKAKVKRCQDKIDGILTKWNQTMLAIGGGKVFSSRDDGGSSDPDSSAYWVTGSYGADIDDDGSPAQLRRGYVITGHYRRASNVRTDDVSKIPVLARQQVAGINFRLGNGKWAGIAEYSKISSKAQLATIASRTRSIIGMEYQIVKDMYLTVGAAHDSQADKSKRSLLANLNWGISKSSAIFPE